MAFIFNHIYKLPKDPNEKLDFLASIAISKNQNGDILSYFSDDIWDLSPYINNKSKGNNFNFQFEIKDKDPKILYLYKEIIIQLKIISYGLLYHEFSHKSVLQFSTIVGYFQIFKSIASLLYENKLNFTKMNNLKILNIIKDKISLLNQHYAKRIILLLKRMRIISENLGLTSYGFNSTNINELLKIIPYLSNEKKQTLIIPTRIYSLYINQCTNKLDDFIFHSKQLFSFLKKFDIHYKKILHSKCESSRENYFLFSKYSKKHKLQEYFKINNISNTQQIFFHLSHIQNLCISLIICFSGMRKTECLNLPYNCFNKTNFGHQEIYIINGFTSKFSFSGNSPTYWISSFHAIPAINAAQLISKYFLNLKDSYIKIEEIPLFPSLSFKKEISPHPLYKIPPKNNIIIKNDISRLSNLLKITSDDFNEITTQDPFRNWEEENIKIGEFWPFNLHQFRRSLAVYSMRSGLVHLPALKEQLKHISLTMTTYYASDSIFVKNFIIDRNLVREIHDQTALEQFVNFTLDVLEQDDLWGAAGTRFQALKSLEQAPEFLTNRALTKKFFNDGRIFYRETPLGGCTKEGNCQNYALTHITACLTCSDAIFNKKTFTVLINLKNNFENLLKHYPSDSPFAIQLINDINTINKLLTNYEGDNYV